MTSLTNLPLVDTFIPVYEVWETRPATPEEMLANGGPGNIKVAPKETIADARAAADYMARVGADNALSNHIEEALRQSADYKTWQNAMPSSTPAAISRYQRNYEKCDFSAVSDEIQQYGRSLSPGQCLFHGGYWPGGCSFVTTRPLSTSLCPQVAFKNAEWKGKPYDAGRLDLFVLRATDSGTKAFVFKLKGTSLGHESEVLLAPGARLTLKTENLIRQDYRAAKYNKRSKEIPIYVLEVEFS